MVQPGPECITNEHRPGAAGSVANEETFLWKYANTTNTPTAAQLINRLKSAFRVV